MKVETTEFEVSSAADNPHCEEPTRRPFFSIDADDSAPPPLEVIERAYVARMLAHTEGRRVVAAQLLGISYPTFLRLLETRVPSRRGQQKPR